MIFIRYFSIIKKTFAAEIGLVSYALEVYCLSLKVSDLLYYGLIDMGIEGNSKNAA